MKKIIPFIISIAVFCYINSTYANLPSKPVWNTWIKIQTGATISPKIAKIKPKVTPVPKTTNTGSTKISNLVWSEEYGSMTYTDATIKCASLSPEWKWHIPTIDELNKGKDTNSTIFTGKRFYWSSTSWFYERNFWVFSTENYLTWQCAGNSTSCYANYYNSDGSDGYYPMALRCVSSWSTLKEVKNKSTIKPKVTPISKTTNTGSIKTGNLVWSEEYGSMTHYDATAKCASLSPMWTWSLPTSDEIYEWIRKNSNIFSKHKEYWTLEPYSHNRSDLFYAFSPMESARKFCDTDSNPYCSHYYGRSNDIHYDDGSDDAIPLIFRCVSKLSSSSKKN